MRRREFTSLALACCTPLAKAQMLPLPPRVTPPAGKPSGAPVKAVEGFSVIDLPNGRGQVATAPDQPIPPQAALTRFFFHYHNGDHKFRRLQLRPEGRQVLVAFNDQNDDDPFAARARWVRLSAGVADAVTGSGHGRAVTKLPISVRAKHVFAIRGFEFRRADNTDANIRHLAIRHVDNFVEVLLSDDEGNDLRTPQGAFNVLDPLHARLPKVLSGSAQRGRPYDVTVQFVWIPDPLIATQGVITGSERRMIDAARVPNAPAVIRGFSFSFLNSDHHLLHIEATTEGGGMGVFRDNNEDDPVRWSIEYATLRA